MIRKGMHSMTNQALIKEGMLRGLNVGTRMRKEELISIIMSKPMAGDLYVPLIHEIENKRAIQSQVQVRSDVNTLRAFLEMDAAD